MYTETLKSITDRLELLNSVLINTRPSTPEAEFILNEYKEWQEALHKEIRLQMEMKGIIINGKD